MTRLDGTPNAVTSSFSYEPQFGQLASVTDPLNHTSSFAYDLQGNLVSATDPLNHQTTLAQGLITYGYDNAGRRTSMTVAGQPQVSYTYDNASRLTQITQGSSSVGFSYDNANRRSSLTLPNGVSVSYSYDNDSQLTGITYNFGANTLGNLSYTYDSLGRRTQIAGSFARTSLPGAVTSAIYDAANELTNWNATAISYDLNGNMLSDGTNAFTWNARNQVATLNGVSLQYDAFGRRIKNAGGTSFLYDGPNAAQELSGSTVTANLLSGGVDEVFMRADSSGAFTPLKDALGSTIALVDSSGNIQTTYSYDPFGNTTVSGATNGNEFQYTGRENEGNGLYFYRNRYYSPFLGRFVREDPAGVGVNFYTYVDDDPIDFSDPLGLWPWGSSTAPSTPPSASPNGGLRLIQGGKNAARLGGLEAAAVLALAAADAELLWEEIQTVAAINAENDAYAKELHAIGQLNAILLAKRPFKFAPMPLPHYAPGTARGNPYPLAGRYTGGGDDGGDDCEGQWESARRSCAKWMAQPNPPYGLIGGRNGVPYTDIEDCARGHVTERCGGNPIDWGPSR